MAYLEEKGIGYDTGAARVPIVPAAAIYDLGIGNAQVRPNADAGYRACKAARGGAVAQGRVGAGTGATVGHVLGPGLSSPGGLGTASQQIGKGIVVGAIVVVNSLGDVVDPQTGKIVAGARRPVVGGWADSASAIKVGLVQSALARAHTTIGVIATDAALTKEQANVVAMMAHDGLARAIRPAHTLFDGDALFVLSAGKKQGDVSAIGHAASEVVADAILRAVK
jgi:L-aminopeptidase/D-esterase-like protein